MLCLWYEKWISKKYFKVQRFYQCSQWRWMAVTSKQNKVINKLLKGWTNLRIIYLLIGLVLIIHTIMDRQIIGVFLGLYILFMGLFGFGCAGGNCEIKENKK